MSRIATSYGNVRSVQRGTISVAANGVSNTATISAVDTNKSTCHWLGISGLQASYPSFCRVELTNSTTVTATFRSGQPTIDTAVVGFEVVEYA